MSDHAPLILVAYFLPAAIGFARSHRDALKISLATVFLGWTGVVWLGALGWSLTNGK